MENASKALLMAGGVLIAIITIALLARSFNTIGIFQKAQLSEEAQAQLVAFNEQYTKYLNQYMYGTEVITVINKALNDKTYEMTVSIKFKEEVIDGVGKTVTIENGKVQDENMTSFINSLGNTDLNTMAFKCTNIGYDESSGRVNSIKFEEKKWE